eukprot:m.96811 g.96811  ORF g.96811 m.96811 type:complete len:132 (+) comp36926_c0_seq1:160-555(+)
MCFIRVYKYGASAAFIVSRSGTCTLDPGHSNEKTVEMAKWFSNHGSDQFGQYDVFERNSEDFALFCKTTDLTVSDLEEMSKRVTISKVTGGKSHQYALTFGVQAIAAAATSPIQAVADVATYAFKKFASLF